MAFEIFCLYNEASGPVNILYQHTMIRNRRSSRRSEPYPSRPLPSSSYSDIVRSDPEIVSRLDTAGPGNRKTGAREFNQDRIARTLRDLFPIPAHKEWKIQHKQGHLLSDPILNVGRSPKSNRDNLGRWLQKVCSTWLPGWSQSQSHHEFHFGSVILGHVRILVISPSQFLGHLKPIP